MSMLLRLLLTITLILPLLVFILPLADLVAEFRQFCLHCFHCCCMLLLLKPKLLLYCCQCCCMLFSLLYEQMYCLFQIVSVDCRQFNACLLHILLISLQDWCPLLSSLFSLVTWGHYRQRIRIYTHSFNCMSSTGWFSCPIWMSLD